jgi:hypothetical protein
MDLHQFLFIWDVIRDLDRGNQALSDDSKMVIKCCEVKEFYFCGWKFPRLNHCCWLSLVIG